MALGGDCKITEWCMSVLGVLESSDVTHFHFYCLNVGPFSFSLYTLCINKYTCKVLSKAETFLVAEQKKYNIVSIPYIE